MNSHDHSGGCCSHDDKKDKGGCCAHEGPHIVEDSKFQFILGLLVIATIITVVASRYDFGNWNLVIALLIASAKAGVVALFFMHLKWENPLTWLYAFFPILLLATLLAGVFIDDPLRHDPKPVTVHAPK